jgi:RsiW-degrading membrane proteinase PrsW (M82 family)
LDQRVLELIVFVLAAFVPSLLYMVWIRNTERYGREPYGRLLHIFIIGATLSVVLAVVLELLLMIFLDMNIERVYEILGEDPTVTSVILAVIIAPLVEELTKALGVFRRRRSIADIEDGIVFGAAAGLGFAATENLLYESSAYFADGAEAFIATTIVRSLASALLHATASSLVGLGIARSVRQRKSWIPYYFGAALIHGLFNLAASFGLLYEGQLGPSAYLFGLAAAFAIALVGVKMVRSKIRELERGAHRAR